MARIVYLAGSIVAGILVVGILLVVLEANPRNDLVDWIVDAARWLAGPFRDLFSLDSNKLRIAVNWGLAALVYSAIARIVGGLLARRSAD